MELNGYFQEKAELVENDGQMLIVESEFIKKDVPKENLNQEYILQEQLISNTNIAHVTLSEMPWDIMNNQEIGDRSDEEIEQLERDFGDNIDDTKLNEDIIIGLGQSFNNADHSDSRGQEKLVEQVEAEIPEELAPLDYGKELDKKADVESSQVSGEIERDYDLANDGSDLLANAPVGISGSKLRADMDAGPKQPEIRQVDVEHLHVEIVRAIQENKSSMQIQMNPEHLGYIDVKISVENNKYIIEIFAEKFDTLEMLLQDSKSLETQIKEVTKSEDTAFHFNLHDQNSRRRGSEFEETSSEDGVIEQELEEALVVNYAYGYKNHRVNGVDIVT